MTIKKRLLLSNILMYVIPVILTMLLIACLYFVFVGITGIENAKAFRYENMFFAMIDEVDATTKKWTDRFILESMKEDIERFNVIYNKNNCYLALYKENELVYPDIGNAIPDIIVSGEGKYALVTENMSIYYKNLGEYTVMLIDGNFNLSYNSPINAKIFIGIAGIILLFFAIIVINRILTNFVYRGIVTPINTIVSGVHEIRDGKLSYRIQYSNNDEFAAVCSDFNDMAAQLSDMVEARRKDEANRRELIAGVSHDLRTPLTSIKAYLEGIEQGVASTPEARMRYINIIKSEADDMEHIINQLFQFSKLDTGEFPFRLEATNIGEELSLFIEANESKYKEEGLVVSLVQNVENVYAEIDAVGLRNVINNILGNSAKYKDKDYVQVKVSCYEDSKSMTITFTDNGPGVPEEALEKLFEVFYRNDTSRSNPSQGSGLGLAISKKIINYFGGMMWAENAFDGGLSIYISLPKCERTAYEKNTDH